LDKFMSTRKLLRKWKYPLIFLGIVILFVLGWRFRPSAIDFGPFELAPIPNNTETIERPYLGITEIKIKEMSPTNLVIESTLKNTGTIPANNIKILPYYTINGKEKTNLLIENLPTYLMPQPSYATYILRIGGHNFSQLDLKNVFILTLKISYDGLTTSDYTTTVSAKYNSVDRAFDITGGDID